MPDVQPCHLLRLPGELRLVVYARVLNETITVHESSTDKVATRHLADPPEIVLASKQVHRGSIALFHAIATFCFECIIHAVHWMHIILRTCLGVAIKSRNTVVMPARLLLGRELEAVLQRERVLLDEGGEQGGRGARWGCPLHRTVSLGTRRALVVWLEGISDYVKGHASSKKSETSTE